MLHQVGHALALNFEGRLVARELLLHGEQLVVAAAHAAAELLELGARRRELLRPALQRVLQILADRAVQPVLLLDQLVGKRRGRCGALVVEGRGVRALEVAHERAVMVVALRRGLVHAAGEVGRRLRA